MSGIGRPRPRRPFNFPFQGTRDTEVAMILTCGGMVMEGGGCVRMEGGFSREERKAMRL